MQEKPDTSSLPPTNTSSLPPALQRVAFTLRTVGTISLWSQAVLAVVSAGILALASFSRDTATQQAAEGTGFGIFFALCGLVALGVGAYMAFRYTRIAAQLFEPNASKRPSKADTLQVIRLGLIVNLLGMLLTLVGAQAIGGSILARALAQPQGSYIVEASRYVRALDLFLVQANNNTLTAHFVGIAASIWLFNRLSK